MPGAVPLEAVGSRTGRTGCNGLRASSGRSAGCRTTRSAIRQMLGFPVARSTRGSVLPGVPSPPKSCGPAPSSTPMNGLEAGRSRVWLWVFTNLRETVYEILPGRGFEQAASKHPRERARGITARWQAPSRTPSRRDAGEISPHGLRVAKGLLQAKMNRLLHGRRSPDATSLCSSTVRVEATNYPAEQDIRIAVVNRTCGGGNRTAKGAERSQFPTRDLRGSVPGASARAEAVRARSRQDLRACPEQCPCGVR